MCICDKPDLTCLQSKAAQSCSKQLIYKPKSFPLTYRTLQIILGNDWACQKTGSLSFPSVSPVIATMRKMPCQLKQLWKRHAALYKTVCTDCCMMKRILTAIIALMSEQTSFCMSNMRSASHTSRLPPMTAAWEPGGSIRRGAPTDRFCPCCS